MELLHSVIKGEGAPLLILHGFLGMADNWKTLGNRFSENGFQVHLIDQRNHGRSFHAGAFGFELMAEDLLRYIIRHRLNDVSIIGHSMGGKTAMFFATAYPQRVSRLVVADIAPRYYAPHHGEILRGLQAVASAEVSGRAEADRLLSGYVANPAERKFLLKNLYWTSEKKLAFRFYLEALVKNSDALGEALPASSQYQGPALFLKAENSSYIGREDAPQLRAHFPNAVIHEIKNAGHWLHADQPEAFFARTLSFLQQRV